MAGTSSGLKASVNLFAVLDENDPGDKRLADLDAKPAPQKKPEPWSIPPTPDYKIKLMKEAASKAAAANKQKPSPSLSAASKANSKKPSPSPSAAAGGASSKARKKPTPIYKANGGGYYDKAGGPAPWWKQRQQQQQQQQTGVPVKQQQQEKQTGVAVKQQEKQPVPVAAEEEQTPPAPLPLPQSPPRLDDMAQFPSLK